MNAQRSAPMLTKRSYRDLAEYAAVHGVPCSEFERWGWCPDVLWGRPGFRYEVDGQARIRFADGHDPRAVDLSGRFPCAWYGLRSAIDMAQQSGAGVIVQCNGEPSTICAQYRGVSAFALPGGEDRVPSRALVADLRRQWQGTVIVAFDGDWPGWRYVHGTVSALRAGGIDAYAVDLGGVDGYDLADWCMEHRETSLQALLALPGFTVQHAISLMYQYPMFKQQARFTSMYEQKALGGDQ